jgi:hypothetical protein
MMPLKLAITTLEQYDCKLISTNWLGVYDVEHGNRVVGSLYVFEPQEWENTGSDFGVDRDALVGLLNHITRGVKGVDDGPCDENPGKITRTLQRKTHSFEKQKVRQGCAISDISGPYCVYIDGNKVFDSSIDNRSGYKVCKQWVMDNCKFDHWLH